jgi:asparagine synthase (glutamine-hydrolysing)
MTMANSLELRVPLLDHKLLEFVAGLPDSYKLYGFETKYIFKNILIGRVPKEILKRRKAGFPVPYARWMSERKDYVMDLLLDTRTKNRGYFEYNKIRNNLIDVWERSGMYPQEIFKLIILELWHRNFTDVKIM